MNDPDDMPVPHGETAQPYVILSLKWTRGPILTWWQPGDMGYTTLLDKAGLYDKADIDARPEYYNNERETLAIPYTQAALMVKQTVLLDNLTALIQRPFWVNDNGISLTKPVPPRCVVCGEEDCAEMWHSPGEIEHVKRERAKRK